MILTEHDDTWRVVVQTDHAHLAGRLVAAWRADGVPEHPWREDLVFAAREHDNGWREADAAPRLHPDGDRPHDFMSIPAADRVEIWRRGIRRFARERPYGALLIALHAEWLHEDRKDQEVYRPLFEELEQAIPWLVEEASADPDEARADYELIRLADALALAAAMAADGAPEEAEGTWAGKTFRGRASGGPDGLRLEIDPFPLAGTTSFPLACRTLPRRPYEGDADLALELAAARWRDVPVRVSPSGDASG
jgi:hypothetical protein